ncbi:MAG: T9SS type A sorting domain-containing protein [Cytophagaceae bacterium]
MKKIILIQLLLISINAFAQLPAGGQWGCPSIPISGKFDTTCFIRTGEIKLGQGYFDHYTASDPVYLVIPQNRPSFALSMAIAWNYYRNVLGRDGMSINQWFATLGQENGFVTYNGVQLPPTIYDESLGMNVALPCNYPRGCNNAGLYSWHVTQNLNDGPYHNTVDGYRTISPYVPMRYPGPESTYHPLYNSNMEAASMNKSFYDLSIYRRAQFMNNVDLTVVEAGSPDPYGVEAAHAVAYNLGPNSAQSIGSPGYTLPAGIGTNNNWSVNYYNGGVSCYGQRVAAMTAVLDNNEAYAQSRYPAACGGNVNNWNFYSFYDQQIRWDTVAASIDRLLSTMYPEMNATTFKNAVKTVFDRIDADANGSISFRYEMGGVIDAIVMNLPKDDPGFNAQYAINGSGCKLDCRAPYAVIKPSGPTRICIGQSVILTAEVESPTASVTYQWQRNGTNIAGATSSTYTVTPSVAGTNNYSVIVCWNALRESNGTSTICCAQSECTVDVTAEGNCSSCVMNMVLTPVQNSCTSMPNGSIQVTIATAEAGPFEYIWSGPSGGTHITSDLNHTITGLRDGKYTVIVRKVSNPGCRAVQDVSITPVTPVKEQIIATANNSSAPVQLDVVLVNQKPHTCNIEVSYGALNAASWDRSFFMDLKTNGTSTLTMYESYPSAGTRDDPWDWWPFSWPNGGAGNAPNVRTIAVNDGDTVSVFGITLVPLGTPVPGFIDGGVRLNGSGSTVTFTELGTINNSNFVTFRYRPPAPSNGTRQMGNSYIVTCPVVSPPAYTFSWSPAAGLSNPNIKNPVACPPSLPYTYTVTATHPVNTSCQLTSQVEVTQTCVVAPMHFLHFSGEKSADQIMLTWITTNENNCAYYTIEKSYDGYSFFPIGHVSCKNIPGTHNYTFEDEGRLEKLNYYRIVESGMEGTTTVSNVVVVNSGVEAKIYPNPFDTSVIIEIYVQDNMAELKIFNIQGQLIETLTLRNGINKLSIGEEYHSGMYFLELMDNNGINNYKMVKN